MRQRTTNDYDNAGSATLVPAKENAAILIDSENKQLRIRLNALEELVGGNLASPYLNFIQGLPVSVDDAERDFGLDLYDRMDNDPSCHAGLDTIVTRMFDQGIQIIPAIDAKLGASEDVPKEAEKAKQYSDLVQWALSEMEEPLDTVLPTMTREMLKVGHKLGEIVGEDAQYDGQLKLRVRALDAKPREVYRFDVDRHNRVQAIQAIIPGVGLVLMEGMIPNPKGMPNSITPEKFLHLINPGKNRTPKGKSRLRPAYNAWYLKQQIWGLYLVNRQRFSGGQLIVTASDNYLPPANAPTVNGLPQDPLTYLANTLALNLRSNGVITLPFGATAQLIMEGAAGDCYQKDVDLLDRQILTAILNQSRSNKEAEHGSKADQGGGMDVADSVINYYKGIVTRTVRTLFKTILRLNEGQEIASKYTPNLNLSGQPSEEWDKNASAAASLMPVVSPKQKNQIAVEKCGLTDDQKWYDQQGEQADELASQTASDPDARPRQRGKFGPKNRSED